MYKALVLAQEGGAGGNGGPGNGNGTDTAPGGGGMFQMLIPFALILLVMYFIMIRPQKKQQKERQAMLEQMAKNDRVITIGGIHGVIYQVKDNEVVLKVDERNDVRMTVAKSAVARVLGDDEAAEKPAE